MKKIILCLYFITFNIHAESYNDVSIVKSITVGADFARIKTVNMIEAESCTNQDWYMVDFNQDSHSAMYTAILTAKVSQLPVRFMLSGCYRNSPKIIHVYVCENNNCK